MNYKYIFGLVSLILLLTVNSFALTEIEKEYARDLNTHPTRLASLYPNITRVFKFTPSEDTIVKIYTTGSSDTYGYLYLPDTSRVIEADDISPENRNFLFEEHVKKGKTYYIAVTGYQNNVTGHFYIHLEYQAGHDESNNVKWITGKFNNNETRSKELEIFWATSLKVYIYGSTEKGYDYVILKDQNGIEVAKLSGNIDQEFIVDGSKVRIELLSDNSIQSEGVTVLISENDGSSNLTNKKLDVLALDQHDYQFNINGVNYSVIGCVPTTYAMMIDYYVKQQNNLNLDIRANINTLLQIYCDNNILHKGDDSSTIVNIYDENFVEFLTHRNMVISNNISLISYTLTLSRKSTRNWNYDIFINKIKQYINENKPIAISVLILKEVDGWFSDYYELLGGHHMLVTGYKGNNALYINDTWAHSSSIWYKSSLNTDYNVYDKAGNKININNYDINNRLTIKSGNIVAIIRTHSASFNIPEYVSFYEY